MVRDVLRTHALLRSEDRGRAALAAERVVDVRHDRDRRLGKPRVEPARVDARHRRQSLRRRRDVAAGGVDDAKAERRQHSRAAVVGAAAAQADHETAHAGAEQRRDHFAHAPGRACRDFGRHAVGVGDADDLRRFDDGGRPLRRRHDAVRGRALPSARAGDVHRLSFPAAREHGVERAFAAVGHRAGAEIGVGPHAAEAARDRPRRSRARRGSP